MKNVFIFIISLTILIISCSEDTGIMVCKNTELEQPIEGIRIAKKIRSYFKSNASNLEFMHSRRLNFLDLKYGLARKFHNDKSIVLEIPVIRGRLRSNKCEDWIRGKMTRATILVQLDVREEIAKINYVEQIPTQEYYRQHSKSLYYDWLIGTEKVYNIDNHYIGNFNKPAALSRTTWEPDSNGIYPGDSIPEIVIPGHQGGGSSILPDNPGTEDASNDTIASSAPICSDCGAVKIYDALTNDYYCPICNDVSNVGGGGSKGGGGNGNSGSQPKPTINPNTKAGFHPQGYLPNYTKFNENSQLPINSKVRLYNPDWAFDKQISFVKRTPAMIIGQSDAGCIPACINHLLLAFGAIITDEHPIWNTYYEEIFKKDNIWGYPIETIKENGINDCYAERLLSEYFEIAAIHSSSEITEILDKGNPIFIIYLKDEDANIPQSHAEVLYGYRGDIWALFDSSCQNYVLWNAEELSRKIAYIYEIKGRK